MPASVDGGSVPARDEGRHAGTDPSWVETWSFDWATADGALGGFVDLTLLPALGQARYTAALVGEGRPLVVVYDHEVPMPRAGLELRTEGLWAAHNLETPLDHWSLGCEAFAVATDEVVEVDGDLRGDRVPFGHDLEWETDGPIGVRAGGGGYDVPCRVTGEVLVGHEVIEVDAPGWRDHVWGPARWGSATWCRGWSSRGGPPVAVDPRGAEAGVPGSVVDDVTVVASAPVRIVAPDGGTSLLTRSLVRAGAGASGWIERNRPDP